MALKKGMKLIVANQVKMGPERDFTDKSNRFANKKQLFAKIWVQWANSRHLTNFELQNLDNLL